MMVFRLFIAFLRETREKKSNFNFLSFLVVPSITITVGAKVLYV